MIWTTMLTAGFVIVAHDIASTASSTSVASHKQGHVAAAGAAYLITNDPSENKVLAVTVGSDGRLGPSIKAFSTEGRGLHGIHDPPPNNDALFSQGSVVVNSNARLLATVNSGSNTVVLFNINPEDPTQLTMVGKPVPSGGEFPQSVTINSRGTQACVLNGGKINGINCFTIHPNLGLIPKDDTLRFLNRSQTTPPVGPPNTLGQVIFGQDDSRVVVSVKGNSSAPGFLATWTVSSTGSLSSNFVKSSPGPGGAQPFSLLPISFPGTYAFFVPDPNAGFEIYNFLSADGKKVELAATSSVVTPVPGEIANCWSTFSERSGNFYVTDAATGRVTEVHVDKRLNATLVTQYPQGSEAGTIDSQVANIGGNDFLYILAANASSIIVLDVNIAGKASQVQSFELTQPANEAGAPITGVNLQGMVTFIKS